ncbi:Arabinose 5-phosphate isomerase KdsD [Andreprevotia sp. IGB-42]|uniref:CBS domain-containing protein n=1 Tax=Andreprevotia sp. IGB-42 TaxID=2497473 RepID=UPI001358689C|nr:CBS domain-containing protein [Andreprevotia sp. IGB-42]KAF0814575.1 Arabinose 5-phosphate isomerase KdsD [Andreprevotia sp. IGB-42]
MKNVRQLLASKELHSTMSVPPQATVYQALQILAEKNIGALLVMEGEQLVGIFSERDYARKVILMGKTSAGTPVSEIMTRKLICVSPGVTVDECLGLMTEKRIRHLPVLDGEKVVGILSIGDLVREKIADQQFTIDQLEHYIHQTPAVAQPH